MPLKQSRSAGKGFERLCRARSQARSGAPTGRRTGVQHDDRSQHTRVHSRRDAYLDDLTRMKGALLTACSRRATSLPAISPFGYHPGPRLFQTSVPAAGVDERALGPRRGGRRQAGARHVARAEDVEDGLARADEIVGDDASVAPPP